MHLWVTSDHGHSPVETHEDLAGLIGDLGYRTVSHPWIYKLRPEVAVMVSGNAMAHIYVDLSARERIYWPNISSRYHMLVERLLERESVDLMILPMTNGATVRSSRGDAEVTIHDGRRLSYLRTSGDPLEIGQDIRATCQDHAYDLTAETDYPDSLAQITMIATSARSGEIILSAKRGWDYRSKYEPIPHVSSHGALHTEHMMVPLLTNRRYSRRPRRTTDVMPSALHALGRDIPAGLDGVSFI
jgi:hypothetical protein